MQQNIIGRKREINLLENCINSNKSEFVATMAEEELERPIL